jgi:hypothetical protein
VTAVAGLGGGSSLAEPGVAPAGDVGAGAVPDRVHQLVWGFELGQVPGVGGEGGAVERVAFAAGFFLRRVLVYQGAVRAMISATITRPALAAHRPGIRFGLIDTAPDKITLR